MDELLNKTDKLNNIKDTRWDRIRKRHTGSLDVKTETVQRFIEMDFVDKKQMKLMTGDLDVNDKLNPTLVMDLRHEMIDRAKSKPYRMPVDRQLAMERLKSHNSSVEKHYLTNELMKFKNDLARKRIKSSKPIEKPKICLNLSHDKIFKSLENCQNRINDFYSAPIEALQASAKLTENSINLMKNNVEKEKSAPVPVDDPAVGCFNEKSNENDDPLLNQNVRHQPASAIDRCVRFEDSVKLINYSRQPSFASTSDGVDSVISEIADQVLIEIEKETKLEMVGKKFDGVYITTTSQITTERDSENIEVVRNRKETFNENGEIVFAVNDDLLRIKKVEPQSKQIQLVVEIQPNEDDSTPTNSESISQEQNAIIAELFRPKMQNKEIMMRKYFLKWIHFTTIEKIQKADMSTNTDRMHKINAFLDKIRKEKFKIRKHGGGSLLKDQENNVKTNSENREKSVVMTKKYKNKIKVQQDIIDLQKLKLERQERMIMELKLNKITEDTKVSKQEIKDELKAIIKTGDVKSRSKAKSLQVVGNLRDEEDDEMARLQGRAYLMPKFLENMKERAMERSIKHEQAKQRRLQHEAEKEAAKTAAEDAKRAEDEEAKRLRIEALKEKRRHEKQAKLQKERDHLRYIANIKKADDFARQRLLRHVGMNGFKKLLEKKRSNAKKSENFRKAILKRNVIRAWAQYHVAVWDAKLKKADDLRVLLLKRNGWHSWILYVSREKSKYLVAIDWHELKLNEKIFNHWLSHTKHQKIIEETKMKQADSHFQWHFKWRVLERWQRLPQVLRLEKETELRRQRWRLKIWELLPDYKPNQKNDRFL